mgnify:CR=1 FL=1
MIKALIRFFEFVIEITTNIIDPSAAQQRTYMQMNDIRAEMDMRAKAKSGPIFHHPV